jgi:hypothetical protein
MAIYIVVANNSARDVTQVLTQKEEEKSVSLFTGGITISMDPTNPLKSLQPAYLYRGDGAGDSDILCLLILLDYLKGQ